MKLQEMPVVLKKREVMEGGKYYLYTYVNVETKEEITISKPIPTIKEVEIEGDNNELTVPTVPEKIVIKGNNNKVQVKEEDLEVPYFLTPNYVKKKKINKLLDFITK